MFFFAFLSYLPWFGETKETWDPFFDHKLEFTCHNFPQVHFRGLPRFTHVATLRGQLPRSLGISPHHGVATSPRRLFWISRWGWDEVVLDVWYGHDGTRRGLNKSRCNHMYQHLQRGAKWFLKGVNSPSLWRSRYVYVLYISQLYSYSMIFCVYLRLCRHYPF